MLERPLPIPLSGILSLPEFEQHARACMPHTTYEYLAAGAGDEHTLRWNRASFDDIRLRPRVLRDVAAVDTTVELFGETHASPIILAPTAYHRTLHAEGEVETARGASAAGVTWCVSSATTTRLPEIAAAATMPLWFQLYVQPDRQVTKELVQHAESAGCRALVVTVDTPNQGARNRQTRAGFVLPPGITAPYMAELAARAVTDTRRGSIVTWDDIAWLRSITELPILLKGIMDGEDAAMAVEAEVDGVIVSNHGARNLDTVPATIDALPEVASVVEGRIAVLMDGAVMRGTDIIKAKARGADAVLVGRPYCYGLALGGAAGVERVVRILRDELEMAMQLVGVSRFDEIDRYVLWD
jgi:4-hydroxymandelate oxidase